MKLKLNVFKYRTFVVRKKTIYSGIHCQKLRTAVLNVLNKVYFELKICNMQKILWMVFVIIVYCFIIIIIIIIIISISIIISIITTVIIV